MFSALSPDPRARLQFGAREAVTRIIKLAGTGRGLERKSKEAGKRVEMSDGHPEVRTGKEHVIDFGDVTDDG